MEHKNISESNEIELHHHSIDDIMGTPPSSMLRVGGGILLIIILFLLIGSNFFYYPDIIRLPVEIKGEEPQAVIIADSEGIIQNWKFDGNVVEKDTLLQFVRNDELYSIYAPVSGHFEINPVVEIRKVVHKQDTIGVIWSMNSAPAICSISINPEEFKKIRIGNKIRIHMDRYPSEQYGSIETSVKAVNYYNSGKELIILAELPSTVVSTSNFHFYLRGNLYGIAEIITNEKSLLDRLINPLRRSSKQ